MVTSTVVFYPVFVILLEEPFAKCLQALVFLVADKQSVFTTIIARVVWRAFTAFVAASESNCKESAVFLDWLASSIIANDVIFLGALQIKADELSSAELIIIHDQFSISFSISSICTDCTSTFLVLGSYWIYYS